MRNFTRPGFWVAILALVLAMGGGAYASSKITGAQIKDGTITSRDVKRHSLDQSSMNFATITSLKTVDSQTLHLQPGQSSVDVAGIGNFKASCPQGMTVIGTGFGGGIGRTADVLSYSYFVGGYMYNDTSVAYDVNLQAICAGSGGAVAVSAGDQQKAKERYARDQRALGNPVATVSCKKANVAGQTKCLGPGQFCATRNERYYKRAGFTCKGGRLKYR